MGHEDADVVAPAVAALRAPGSTRGPLPADTMFHAEARETYDAAICMYHDQALIPLKALDFDAGVNVTLGLPIVRTSPDHGTAFAIAGTGTARAGATVAAIRMAGNARCAGFPHDRPTAPIAAIARGGEPPRPVRQQGAGPELPVRRTVAGPDRQVPGSLRGANVLEVGPGPGGLTRALLRAGANVTAIEMDKRCLPALRNCRMPSPAS
jgi:hypothetical protein